MSSLYDKPYWEDNGRWCGGGSGDELMVAFSTFRVRSRLSTLGSGARGKTSQSSPVANRRSYFPLIGLGGMPPDEGCSYRGVKEGAQTARTRLLSILVRYHDVLWCGTFDSQAKSSSPSSSPWHMERVSRVCQFPLHRTTQETIDNRILFTISLKR